MRALRRLPADQALLVMVIASMCVCFLATSLDRFSAAPGIRALVAQQLSGYCLDNRVFNGEAYRAVSHMWLHGSVFHLFCNASSLVLLWVLARRALAPGMWLVVVLVTGAAAGVVQTKLSPAPPPDFTAWKGALATYFWEPNTACVGASGGISGLWGLLTAITLRWWWMTRRGHRVDNPVGTEDVAMGPAWLLVPFLIQMAIDARVPGIAGLAHDAGYLAGMLCLPLARPLRLIEARD